MSRIQHVSVNGIESKVCSACHQAKPLLAFPGCNRRSDGLDSRCRECAREDKVAFRKKVRFEGKGHHSMLIAEFATRF